MAQWHEVKQGESLIRLGDEFGFAPDTIWSHPENKDLKDRRKDMNELLPGDRLFIPDPRRRIEQRPVDFRHVFRRKGVPAQIRIQVLYHGEPVANAPFSLGIDEEVIEGTTDARGVITAVIPPRAEEGLLVVQATDKNRPAMVIPVDVGHLDPLNSQAGRVKRLKNLGFWRMEEAHGKRLSQAVRRFQLAAGLPLSGALDSATVAALESFHDTPRALDGSQTDLKVRRQ